MAGIGYWISKKLYIAVTNRNNATPFMNLRGPSFTLPQSIPLEKEPSPEDILRVVDDAFERNLIHVSSTESDEVTFAGQGEPLLRYDTICEAAVLIKMKRHGVPLRLKTNGLVTSSTCPQIVSGLRQAGFSQLTVHLAADNPKQYMELMKPTMDLNFGDVCSFILAAVEAELEVTCTAVDVPGIDMSSVRALSVALGAVHFRPIKYFP